MGNKILMAVHGFEETQENMIRDKLNALGAEIESIITVHTKIGVLQDCTEDIEIQAAVISEYLESGFPYQPEEFDEVDAIREDLRVIPILMNEHRGKKYAEKLHALAIYNAIFEENADMEAMAELIRKGRNKKAAKLYYNIWKNQEIITDRAERAYGREEQDACLLHVLNGGKREDFLTRLMYVEKRLSYEDFKHLLLGLPAEYMQEARDSAKYQEFFSTDENTSDTRKNEKDIKKHEGNDIEDRGPSMENKKSIRKVERTIVKEKIVPKGTMELGICASSHGIGATYTSILCAQSLAGEYKVAYVEQNKSGHIQCMLEEFIQKREANVQGGIFSYQGVDYYFGMDYLQFAMKHRNAYDFVVADFGALDTETNVQEFFRMNKHFLVIPHVLWRTNEISSCCEWMQEKAQMEDAVFLTPYAVDANLRIQIEDLFDPEEILEVGYVADAFHPGVEQKNLFYRLCGVQSGNEQKKVFQRISKRFLNQNFFAKARLLECFTESWRKRTKEVK